MSVRDINGGVWSLVRERFLEEEFLSQIWKDDLLGGEGRKQEWGYFCILSAKNRDESIAV